MADSSSTRNIEFGEQKKKYHDRSNNISTHIPSTAIDNTSGDIFNVVVNYLRIQNNK